jgi:hypothetical protein
VRRLVKVAVWIGVFAVCAGAGAYVAAHTNPFPPGVEDPGARSPSPTTAAPAVALRWSGTMRSRTEHVFHVGGSCVTRWRTRLSFSVHGAAIHGTGVAKLAGEVRCDFPEVQVQTVALQLQVSGVMRGDAATLGFAIVGEPDPRGSTDLGGLTATLALMHPRADLGARPASTTAHAQRPDGDLGVFRSTSRLTLDCARGC